jgi:hypothetical protein
MRWCRSNSVTSAGGNCAAELMRTPVSTAPPNSASTAISASTIDCDPPAATGQPWRWPAVMMPSPIADVIG